MSGLEFSIGLEAGTQDWFTWGPRQASMTLVAGLHS